MDDGWKEGRISHFLCLCPANKASFTRSKQFSKSCQTNKKGELTQPFLTRQSCTDTDGRLNRTVVPSKKGWRPSEVGGGGEPFQLASQNQIVLKNIVLRSSRSAYPRQHCGRSCQDQQAQKPPAASATQLELHGRR